MSRLKELEAEEKEREGVMMQKCLTCIRLRWDGTYIQRSLKAQERVAECVILIDF